MTALPDNSDTDRIAVAGAINSDVLAFAGQPLNLHDSNPGRVSESHGGVGLNIARNLVRLGVHVDFLTAVGAAFDGARLPAECRTPHMRTDGFVAVANGPTSRYVAVHDASGDMLAAVSDMRLYDELPAAALAPVLPRLKDAAVLVVETNLNEPCLDRLTAGRTVPLVCDPVSVAKSARIRPFLPRLAAIKPNVLEAEALLGRQIRSEAEAIAAAVELVRAGARLVCLSRGEDGILLTDGHRIIKAQGRPRLIRSATGAGDAMTAMLAVAVGRRWSLAETATLAVAASLVALEHEEAVSPRLGDCYKEDVRARIRLTDVTA